MAKKKIKRFPGSIFAQNKKLYIKYKGIRTATGLGDTQVNIPIAEKILERIYLADMGLDEKRNIQIRIKDAFEEFKIYKSNKMDKTIKQTVLAYRRIVSNNYILEIRNIEKDIIQFVIKKDLSNVTIANYLRHIFVFFNWCYKKKYIDDPHYLRDFMPKYSIFPKIYEVEEIRMLIDYFDIRNKEISNLIQFMLNTGARMTDALNLYNKDIDGNTIIWHNKINKNDEPRPISNYVLEIIKDYRERDKLFKYSYHGASYLNKELREACLILGIERNERSFQEFRVTFRMRLKQKGLSEIDIKYLLRHSFSGTMEKYYTGIYNNELLGKLNKIGKIE